MGRVTPVPLLPSIPGLLRVITEPSLVQGERVKTYLLMKNMPSCTLPSCFLTVDAVKLTGLSLPFSGGGVMGASGRNAAKTALEDFKKL